MDHDDCGRCPASRLGCPEAGGKGGRMAIHDHLPRIPKPELKLVGRTKQLNW